MGLNVNAFLEVKEDGGQGKCSMQESTEEKNREKVGR